MEYLKEVIKQKGKVLKGDVLKVDNFLNHQIDVEIIDKIGKEFARLFINDKPTKILTVEASGIAVAQAVSLNMNLQKVVFAKKDTHKNMSSEVYSCMEKSYTRDVNYQVKVSKEYLNENDKVLIIDDFLANGEAVNALYQICKQANAEVVGIGVVIGKLYQPGFNRINKLCKHIEVLAKIKSMSEDGTIEFEE